MTYEDIVFDYNNRALDDRTWDMISDRERVEFVLRVRGMQEPVCYQALFDAIAAATSVAYAPGINISIEAFTAKIGPLYTAPQPCPSCEVNEAIGAGNAELIEMLQAECKKLKAERDDALRYKKYWTEWVSLQSGDIQKLPERAAQADIIEAERDELQRDKQLQGQIISSKVQQIKAQDEYLQSVEKNLLEALQWKEQAGRERDELTVQVTHWKANHASVVEQARILKERPDMPIERVKAYENWVAMAAQVEKMQNAIDSFLAANDPTEFGCACSPSIGYSCGPCSTHKRQTVLREALALPDLSTGILNKARAEALDAKRYRWLREQYWKTSDLCAVSHPDVSVKLGYECPSGERLDELIDRALAADMEQAKCKLY